MSANATVVWLLLVAASSLVAEERNESSQAKLEQAQFEARCLRQELENQEENLEVAVHPDIKFANWMISSLQEATGLREGDTKEAYEFRKKACADLENHYRLALARTRLDPNAGVVADLLGLNLKLDETAYAKGIKAKIQGLKEELSKKLEEVKTLQAASPAGGDPARGREPGVVPELFGLKRRQAGSAIQAAQLIGRANYAEGKPKTPEELDNLVVIGQNPAAGTNLTNKPEKERIVMVTLSSKPAASRTPADSAAGSPEGPRDGLYNLGYDPAGGQVAGAPLLDVATVEWKNNTDGSAVVTLKSSIMTKLFGPGAETQTGFKNGTTFLVVRTPDGYVAGGKDMQDFAAHIFKEFQQGALIQKSFPKEGGLKGEDFDNLKAAAAQAVNGATIENNFRVLVRTKGADGAPLQDGLVLKADGLVRIKGSWEGKAYNGVYPPAAFQGAELIGKLFPYGPNNR